MKYHHLARLAICLLLACSLAAMAQTVSAQDTRPRRATAPQDTAPVTDDPVALEAALVEVPVVVSDRSGHYITTLRQDDVEVYEDGVRQEIAFFRNDRVPIHVAIVMDTSGSTRESLPDIQEAAIEFINKLLPGDQIMIVSFSDRVRVEQEFTSDRRRLIDAVRNTESIKGTTLYDAVYGTVTERLAGIDGRKAMILLTDGKDTRSSHTADEALAACSERDVSVYAIRYPNWHLDRVLTMPGGGKGKKKKNRGIHIPGIPNIPGVPHIPGLPWPLMPQANAGFGGDFMEQITATTGGTLFDSTNVGDLSAHFDRIAEELRHVYTVGYSPTKPVSAGGYRAIRIAVPAHPEYAVRHRLGYKAGA